MLCFLCFRFLTCLLGLIVGCVADEGLVLFALFVVLIWATMSFGG